MNILDILRQSSGGDSARGGAVNALARTYGVEPAAAEAVLESVVPQLSQRIERNTLSRGGVADLVGALGKASQHDYLANPQSLGSLAVTRDGIGFLDQILWSKDKSRAVAQQAAQASGLSEALIKQMLPAIAAIVMGGLAKGAAGGLGDILSKIPGLPGGGQLGDGGFGGQPPRSTPRTAPSGGRLGGDGNSGGGGGSWGGSDPLPMPGGGDFGGQSPLPLPGDAPPGRGSQPSSGNNNPYDDLSDIIRRGGQSAPGNGGGGGGGSLANMIRTILGAILGFQSRGLLSWIIRYVVVRYGAGILRALVGILLGRRI